MTSQSEAASPLWRLGSDEQSACLAIKHRLARTACTLAAIRQYAARFRDVGFPWFFGAMECLRRGDTNYAKTLLDSAGGNLLAKACLSRIETEGSLSSLRNVWEDIQPYQAWARSAFARRQFSWIIEQVRALSPRLPHGNSADTLVDLGTGDGALLCDVVDAAQHLIPRGKMLRLLLVDQTESTLECSVRYLRNKWGKSLNIEPQCCRIEDWNPASIDPARVIFVHSCACIHHLTRANKVRFFSRLAGLPISLLLFELEGNHDMPDSGSAEIIYSTYMFYEYLMADAAQSLKAADVALCNDSFLLEEAIPLLTQPYVSRANYHMLAAEWSNLGQEAGCNIRELRTGCIARAAPRLLLLWYEGTIRTLTE